MPVHVSPGQVSLSHFTERETGLQSGCHLPLLTGPRSRGLGSPAHSTAVWRPGVGKAPGLAPVGPALRPPAQQALPEQSCLWAVGWEVETPR